MPQMRPDPKSGQAKSYVTTVKRSGRPLPPTPSSLQGVESPYANIPRSNRPLPPTPDPVQGVECPYANIPRSGRALPPTPGSTAAQKVEDGTVVGPIVAGAANERTFSNRVDLWIQRGADGELKHHAADKFDASAQSLINESMQNGNNVRVSPANGSKLSIGRLEEPAVALKRNIKKY